ncbi:MAG: hypothetical protein WAO58_07580 [Fimbriimonadaceae bacterium]
MQAKDFGYLACRFLAILFFALGVFQLQMGLSVQASLGSMDDGTRRTIERQFPAVWINYGTGAIYFAGTLFLWYGAGWLSGLFVRDSSAQMPRVKSNAVLSTGLGLIGVYFLIRELPNAMDQIALLFRTDDALPMLLPQKVAFWSPLIIIAISAILVFRHLIWQRLFDSSFRELEQGERDVSPGPNDAG